MCGSVLPSPHLLALLHRLRPLGAARNCLWFVNAAVKGAQLRSMAKGPSVPTLMTLWRPLSGSCAYHPSRVSRARLRGTKVPIARGAVAGCQCWETGTSWRFRRWIVIEEALGKPTEIRFLPLQPAMSRETSASPVLHALSGYVPATPLDVGVRLLVECIVAGLACSRRSRSTYGGEAAALQ